MVQYFDILRTLKSLGSKYIEPKPSFIISNSLCHVCVFACLRMCACTDDTSILLGKYDVCIFQCEIDDFQLFACSFKSKQHKTSTFEKCIEGVEHVHNRHRLKEADEFDGIVCSSSNHSLGTDKGI